MPWLTTVRSLLRDLLHTKASSPSQVQLEHLHVEMYETYELLGLENIELIRSFIENDDFAGCASEYVEFFELSSAHRCSSFVSMVLCKCIAFLSRQAADKLYYHR